MKEILAKAISAIGLLSLLVLLINSSDPMSEEAVEKRLGYHPEMNTKVLLDLIDHELRDFESIASLSREKIEFINQKGRRVSIYKKGDELIISETGLGSTKTYDANLETLRFSINNNQSVSMHIKLRLQSRNQAREPYAYIAEAEKILLML
jgi:hypothetical protein